MKQRPLRTTVIGSYPFPGWLEFASSRLDEFGADDLAELLDDAVTVAVDDQIAAGLDVITDGEQTRLDFNLSFYGFLTGIAVESQSARRFGPPAHDQRGKHEVTGTLGAPKGLGAVDDFLRISQVAGTSKIAAQAEYDAGAQLITLKEWPRAIQVLEHFRANNPKSEFSADVTRKLAVAPITTRAVSCGIRTLGMNRRRQQTAGTSLELLLAATRELRISSAFRRRGSARLCRGTGRCGPSSIGATAC
jgi:hypothetical protein